MLTKNAFVKFINSINYRIWIEALKNVNNTNNPNHIGGVFSLYSQIINTMPLDNSGRKEFQDSLQINKALYDIAYKNKFFSLCDFMTGISKEMIISASEDIKEYMVDHINVFGEQGLVEICFQRLMSPEDFDNLDKDFWEHCLKDIYELYRMIPN